MPLYKVRKTHLGWFREETSEDDELSEAVVEELHQKLAEREEICRIISCSRSPTIGVDSMILTCSLY